MKKYLLLLVLCSPALNAHNFLSTQQAQQAWQERDYDKARDILEKALVHRPDDPELHYNLANVYHMIGLFDGAIESYARVIADEKSATELREQALFNLGNTAVQKAQAVLGQNWEERQIEDEVLTEAADCLHSAIDHYNDVIEMDHESERAPTNRAYAKELLDKIEKKKKQDEQQQKKDDKKNKKQNDQPDKQPKQDKQKKKDKDKRNKDDQKQKQEKSNPEHGDDEQQKNQQPQPDQAEKGSPRPDSTDESSQDNADQDNTEPGDMEGSDEHGHREGGGDRSEDGQEGAQDDNDDRAGTGAAVGEESAEQADQERNAMLALLQSLDAKEAEKHRAFIARHAGQQAPAKPGQKNW